MSIAFSTASRNVQGLSSYPNPAQPGAAALSTERPLHERITGQITAAQTELDRLMPNFWIQDYADQCLRMIEEAFNCPSLQPFNEWINSSGNGEWYQQLATFVAKLPLKAARNIIHTIASLIKGTLQAVIYTAAHPLKAPLELAKWIVNLANELSKPEVWTKIGISMMGSNIGYALATGNPISTLLLAIGGTMALAGISMGALKEAIYAEQGHKLNAAHTNVITQMKNVAEEMATGLCLGLLIGGVQQAVRSIQQAGRNISHSMDTAASRTSHGTAQARDFINEHHMPQYDRININNNSIKMLWEARKGNFVHFPQNMPGAQMVMEEIITSYESVREFAGYVTTVADNGVSITQAVYETRQIPIYTDMIGYNIPIQGWTPPPTPPAVTMANIATTRVLPLSVAEAVNS
ncbi:MAG: hypothetical protein NTX49_07040 [Chlamydiae bacterium]|nr:hypothetical protein [Chlamydiota bacterium]